MKILQAVVTSAVETIDANQGFGLVRCSKVLPQELRKVAKDFGHSDDADGQPIYAFKIEDVESEKWFILNRAMPAVDYTGRSSFVSHTLAFKKADWDALSQEAVQTMTPFEFMANFHDWVSEWGGSLELWEEDADWELSSLCELDRCSSKWDYNANKRLLTAFDYSIPERPVAKRLVWNIPAKTPKEVLQIFHQAWMNLDPWRGNPRHQGLLNEPEISLHDSWDCTFTTNLRNSRPDPYHWVLMTQDQEKIQSRESIDFSCLPEDEEQIGNLSGSHWKSLLLDRCDNPEEWANNRLGERLEDTRKEIASTLTQIRADIAFDVEAIFAEIDQFISNEQEKVPSESYFDQEEALTKWHELLKNAEDNLENRIKNETYILCSSIKSIAELLGQSSDEFPEYHQAIHKSSANIDWQKYSVVSQIFKEISIKSKMYSSIVSWSESSKSWQDACKDKESKINELIQENEKWKEKCRHQEQIIKSIDRQTSASPSGRLNKRKSCYSDWKCVVIWSLGLASLLLLIWLFFDRYINSNQETTTPASSSEDSIERRPERVR